MEDLIIGRRLFTDGTTRAVYLDESDQYVLDDHAEVYGAWVLTDEVLDEAPLLVDLPDLPHIVGGKT